MHGNIVKNRKKCMVTEIQEFKDTYINNNCIVALLIAMKSKNLYIISLSLLPIYLYVRL